MKCVIKEIALLQEAKNVKDLGNQKVSFNAKLQMLEEYSYNGKLYKKSPMLEALTKKKHQLEIGGFVGEMDHPMDPSMMRIMNVLYQNVSHVFKEIWTEGNAIWGRLENTSNRIGVDLYNFIVKDRLPIGFSLRATGETRRGSQGLEVYSDIDLITWDAVSSPSFSNCILQEINDVKHLESATLSSNIANLEAYVYGKSDSRTEMLLESKMSKPMGKLIECLEGKCVYENEDFKFKVIRDRILSITKAKLYSL